MVLGYPALIGGALSGPPSWAAIGVGVIGGLTVINGADNLIAGGRSAITGEYTQAMLEKAVHWITPKEFSADWTYAILQVGLGYAGIQADRLLQGRALVHEAAGLTSTSASKYVDDIIYSSGYPRFTVTEEGKRILTIGSKTLRKTKGGRLLDALHEMNHAKKWHHTLQYKYRGNFLPAYQEFMISKPFGSYGYAFDEVIAERLALQKLSNVFRLSSEEFADSIIYIHGWGN